MLVRTRASYAAQFFFGGWFLLHGLNYWLHFFPQGGGGSHGGLIPALIDSGLFDIVKAMEIAIGLMLLANVWAPLANVAAVPITLTIVYVNVVLKHDLQGLIVAVGCILLQGLMVLGHLGTYRPLLAIHAGHPDWGARPTGRTIVAAAATDGLSLRIHLIGVLLGIAAPLGLTLASTL